MSSDSPVRLVPWDPESDEHARVLLHQRDLCGWDNDKIPKWKATQTLGSKCLFWITLPTEGDNAAADLSLLPKDEKPLCDTGATLRGTARTPTQQPFYPIGHISLDIDNPGVKKANLDIDTDGIYWIKTFYVLSEFQSKGIGRAAMDIIESMAVAPPLCARTLGLDTVQREDAIMLHEMKTGQKPKTTNQEWYARRGYQLIKTVQNLYHEPEDEGKLVDFKGVFMIKHVA